MRRMLLLWSGLGMSAQAQEDPRHLDASSRLEALEQEIARAMELSLPEQPEPYLVRARMVTGSRVLAEAEFGAMSWKNTSPVSVAGVEVRVGNPQLDNGNFQRDFGERDGVVVRGLPTDAHVLALRRELWLAFDEAYKGATEQYAAKVAAREGRAVPEEDWELIPAELPGHSVLEPRPLDLDPIAELARGLSAVFAEYDSLERGRVQAWQTDSVAVLASTEGPPSYRREQLAVIRAEAVVRAEDGSTIRGLRSWTALDLESLPEETEIAAELHRVAQTLQQQRLAVMEEDYLGPVIFEGPAAIELFRQLALPELSGSPPAEKAPDPWETHFGTVPPVSRVGRRLLPEGWSVDDVSASSLSLPGGSRLDMEGVPTRPVALVRDGVVQNLLMSRVPRDGFESSTGHGTVGHEGRILASPGVVEIRPRRHRRMGRLERRALQLARQADLPYVLIIRQMTPLAMSEDVSYAFSGDTRMPGLSRPIEVERLYTDGRRERVRGLGFVGVDRRVLRDIALAGPSHGPVSVTEAGPTENRWSVGETGGIGTTWTAPAVLISELELHGSGGQEVRVLPPPS